MIIVRMILYGLLLGLMYTVTKKIIAHYWRTPSSRKPRLEIEEETLVEDPQCHVFVPLPSAHERIIGAERHYFCSVECAEEYVRWHTVPKE